MGKSAGKSCTGDVGEKLVRVVGFGAFRDRGGFVLGFNIGGDSGSGIKLGKDCFLSPEVTYILLPIGHVAVFGGESGIAIGGYVLVRGLTGFDRRGLGNVGRDMAGGDGGGEGVDVVERKVGPGSADAGDTV
jgi:hypothetical protein